MAHAKEMKKSKVTRDEELLKKKVWHEKRRARSNKDSEQNVRDRGTKEQHAERTAENKTKPKEPRLRPSYLN